MKSTGIVRRLDELGRITLPKELRRTLGINIKDPVEIYTEGRQIIIEKYEDNQVCCNCGKEDNNLIRAEHGCICSDCLDTFNAWAFEKD